MALAGKVALIAGGVKNLGAQIALELAAVGANLALHYNSHSSKDDAVKLEKALKAKHPSLKVAFYQGDLTTETAVNHLFTCVLRDFGKIDIVINTVGKVLKKPITEISEAEYDHMFAYVLPVPLLVRHRMSKSNPYLCVQHQLEVRFLHSESRGEARH